VQPVSTTDQNMQNIFNPIPEDKMWKEHPSQTCVKAGVSHLSFTETIIHERKIKWMLIESSLKLMVRSDISVTNGNGPSG